MNSCNQTLADQNRACEIFVNARKDIGDDLTGFSLVDLLPDNAGWPLDACRELAAIVVERCECSERIRIKYGQPDPMQSRITELARVAYHGYGVSVGFMTHDGDKMPAWDELPDRIKRGWHGSIVEILLEYQAGASSSPDPGETVLNSEHHFASGEVSGLSMRMITRVRRGGTETRVIIERDIHESNSSEGVERLLLNFDEALELTVYLARTRTMNFWRE